MTQYQSILEESMTRKDSFTYSVTRTDFPIVIEVESFDQADFMGVISDGIVVRPVDGSVIMTFPLSLRPMPGNSTCQRCDLPSPDAAGAYQPPADVNLSLVVSYATANGLTPRYEVRLTPASGSTLIRTIRRPNLRDFFAFEYR